VTLEHRMMDCGVFELRCLWDSDAYLGSETRHADGATIIGVENLRVRHSGRLRVMDRVAALREYEVAIRCPPCSDRAIHRMGKSNCNCDFGKQGLLC
jgi:hypothetical protein